MTLTEEEYQRLRGRYLAMKKGPVSEPRAYLALLQISFRKGETKETLIARLFPVLFGPEKSSALFDRLHRDGTLPPLPNPEPAAPPADASEPRPRRHHPRYYPRPRRDRSAAG